MTECDPDFRLDRRSARRQRFQARALRGGNRGIGTVVSLGVLFSVATPYCTNAHSTSGHAGARIRSAHENCLADRRPCGNSRVAETVKLVRVQATAADVTQIQREKVAAARRTAEATTGDRQAQRTLAAAYERLGAVLRNQGDLPGALDAFRPALAIREQLASGNPDNIDFQLELLFAHHLLGDVLHAQKNGSEALLAYRSALAILDRLAAVAPSDTGLQYRLALGLLRVGLVAEQVSEPGAGRQELERGLDVANRLAASGTDQPRYKQLVAQFETALAAK